MKNAKAPEPVMRQNPEDPCPLCGGDVRLKMIHGTHVSRCQEHEGAVICGTCMLCTSLEPTPEVLEHAKETRAFRHEYLEPIIEEMRRKYQ